MKSGANAEAIEKSSRHTDISPFVCVRDTAHVSLIPLLFAPFDQSELEKALDSASSGMALLDATGLQADTLLYAEERFFSLYERSVETARDALLFLLCPPLVPQESILSNTPRQTSASRELLLSQLRAALRASAKGHIALVLPFVHTVQEIELARRSIEQAMRELTARKLWFDETVMLGVLLETPAALALSHGLIEAADFVMINIDPLSRPSSNAAPVSKRFDELCLKNAQTVLDFAEMGIGNAHLLGRFVALGGSPTFRPHLFPHFLAMGASNLIVPVHALEQVKGTLRGHT